MAAGKAIGAASEAVLGAIQELLKRGKSADEVYYKTGYARMPDGEWLNMEKAARMERAAEQGFTEKVYRGVGEEGYKADPLSSGKGFVLYGPDGAPITTIKNRQQLLDMNEPVQAIDDYRISHRAPSKEGANTLDNLADVYPDDVYNPSVAGRYYGHGDNLALDNQTARILAKYRGKPDASVTVYRAVPKGVTDINPGDWVTVNKNYAKSHGSSWVDDGNYDIISKKVRAKDVTSSGDSIHEQGYVPLLAGLGVGGVGALGTQDAQAGGAASSYRTPYQTDQIEMDERLNAPNVSYRWSEGQEEEGLGAVPVLPIEEGAMITADLASFLKGLFK